MIQELREYVFTKDKWPEYWSLFNELCLPIRRNEFGVLSGLWLHEGDDHFRFYHLWQYESLNERARLRSELAKVPDWRNYFLPQAAVTLKNQFIRVVNAHLELNTESKDSAKSFVIYQCKPGQVGEYVKFIKRNDRNVLSIWQSEFGNPNEIILLRDCSFEYDRKHYHSYVEECHMFKVSSLT